MTELRMRFSHHLPQARKVTVTDDDAFTTPGLKVPPRKPQPGERLFEFRRGHDRFLVELRDHGQWGVEAQFYQNEEFFFSRRFDTRDLAEAWAALERADLRKGG